MSSAPHHHDAENVGVLPGLPGSDTSAGTGPAVAELFAGFVEDAAAGQGRGRREGVVAAHVARAGAGYGRLVSALVVPAEGCDGVIAELEAVGDVTAGIARVLAVVVEADPDAADPLAQAADAATTLDARDDVRVVAVSVPLPGSGDPAAVADLAGHLGLATPRDGVRIWVQVAPGRGLPGVLDVLVRAGVGACLPVGGATDALVPSTDDLAAVVRGCVDAEVPVRLTGGPGRAVRGPDPATGVTGHGVLNVVGAMRAALNGAEAPEVAGVLASTDTAALASGTRRISEADAAVLRAFWVGCAVPDVTAPVKDLVELGLLPAP